MTVNVVDYGADPAGAKDSTSAFAAAVHDLETPGLGGTLLLPPGNYKGALTFAANLPIRVDGYGATIHAPSGGWAVKANARPGGSSAQVLSLAGLRLVGQPDLTSVGLHIRDSNNVHLDDAYIMRCRDGILLESTTTARGCESTSITRSYVYQCTTGVRFTAGVVGSSFMQTVLSDVKLADCGTSLLLPAGSQLFRRAVFEKISMWIPAGKVGVDCDADLFEVRAEWRAEAGTGGGAGSVGVKVGPNSTRWDTADVALGIPPVVATKIDLTNAAPGFVAAWTEGRASLTQVKR